MNCYVQPYEGEKPYLFFSYCHKDASRVYSVIERLTIDGYRVWFDDGLHPGDDWPEVIAQHLFESAACIIAVSEEYAQSSNCKNELTFAINHNKPIISLVLEEFKMSRGLALQIGRSNYINYYEYQDNIESFYVKLEASDSVSACREPDHLANHYAMAEWKKHSIEYSKGEKRKPKIDIGKLFFSGSGGKVVENTESLTGKSELPVTLTSPPLTQNTGLREVIFVPQEDLDVFSETGEKSQSVKKYEKEQKESGEETAVKRSFSSTELKEDPFDKTKVKNSAFSGEDEDPNDKTTPRKPKVIPTIGILIRKKTGEVFQMKEGEISIGRDSRQADFVIENQTISRHHADIIFNEGKFYLKDNESTNGTVFLGQKLEEEPVELTEFCKFFLDEEEIVFASNESMKKIWTFEEFGYFSTLKAVETGEERVLGKEAMPLDRNNSWNEGVLKDQYINRKDHAQVLLKEDGFYIQDIHSTNGTYLNGEVLKQGEERKLDCGDEIRIVDTPFIYSIYMLKFVKEEKE